VGFFISPFQPVILKFFSQKSLLQRPARKNLSDLYH